MESRHSLIGVFTGLTVLVLAGISALAGAQQQNDLVLQSPSSAGQMSIAIEKGLITASIRNSPFDAVLEQLASQTGAAFVPADDLDIRAIRVSAELAGVPLGEGLRLLFNNYDVFFYYGAVGTAPSSLRMVWFYRKGAAANIRPVPPEVWASTKDLQTATADPDPVVRARAYEALMSRPDRDSRELVLSALRGLTETNDAVRERTLAIASSTDMQLPPDLLMDLVRSDRDEGVRLNALNALASEPTLKEAARVALTDPSETVRKRARVILAELEANTDK
jgi:hypothetical protein